jgi:hypothetical protein
MTLRLLVRRFLVLVLVAVTGACAHDEPKPADPYMVSGLASMRAWLTDLPRCPPQQALQQVAAFRQNELTDTVAVRGQLTLSATPACPPKACGGACCSNCMPTWVVVPNAGAGPGELAIQKSGMKRPLTAVVQDCKLESMRRELPPTEVLVSGFREGNVIIRASLCVVDPVPPAPSTTAPPTTASLGGT